VGVGIELRPAEPGSADAGLFVISDITPGGPAARAGVRPLDRVLAVEGASYCTCQGVFFDSDRPSAAQALR
jgi:S1-C subfamily serine protease